MYKLNMQVRKMYVYHDLASVIIKKKMCMQLYWENLRI